MKIRQGFKFRLEPISQQIQKFAQQAGSCRFVYNKLLALNQSRYLGPVLKFAQPKISCFDGQGLLKLWKQSEEYGWLKEADSQALQASIQDLERAYTNFFQRRAAAPTKRKKFQDDSFRYPQRVKVEDNRIYLPKVGWVKFRKSREIIGTIKNVTVSRKGDHWFVSVQTEYDIHQPTHPSEAAVGIDLGVVQFATLSNGTMYQPVNSFRRLEAKLAKLQRQLSLKVKSSNNWIKVKRKINRLYTRIADIRRDHLHKVSTEISQNHAVIVVEDLKVANMSKSASGTVENPGRQVAQKSGLNKSILDQGWGMFRTMLEYKQLWRGGMVMTIPPQYTSQTCSQCGTINAESRRSQAEFVCIHCGYSINADVNASANILAVGLTDRLNACGA